MNDYENKYNIIIYLDIFNYIGIMYNNKIIGRYKILN